MAVLVCWPLIGGTIGVVLGQGVAFTLGHETVEGGASPVWLWTVIRTNRTWAHYDWFGNLFNSGTWTPCAPGVMATGTTPSTSR